MRTAVDDRASSAKILKEKMKNKKYFAVMLDCSRNAVTTVNGVKKFADIISSLGYNALMLYTEDTYEIAGEPLFGYMRGRYSKAELKEIDDYCFSKGIELIPCIQTLAHLRQIFQHPTYWDAHDLEDILKVGAPRTYELIEKMFATCRECFRSDRINIGMDEAHMLGLGHYLDENGYKNRFELFCEHLKKVLAISDKYKYKPMMWSDMFFASANKARYYTENGYLPESYKKIVPENVSLVYWDYYSEKKEKYENIISQHRALGNELWFAGGAWKWNSFSVSNKVTMRRTKEAFKACEECGIDNVIVTVWGGGGGGDEAPLYSVLPSLYYIAGLKNGVSDLSEAEKGFNDKFGENFSDFMLLDLDLGKRIPRFSETLGGVRAMLYCDPFLGRFDSAVWEDGREERAWKRLSKKLFAAEKRSKNYGYIFKTYGELCAIMSVKHGLGVKTRKAYAERNYEELKKLTGVYSRLARSVENFAETFYLCWTKERKPQGFEVQQARLGGLALRLKHCAKRLKNFVLGNADKIEELEEKTVDCLDGSDNFTKKIIDYNNYLYSFTTNVY